MTTELFDMPQPEPVRERALPALTDVARHYARAGRPSSLGQTMGFVLGDGDEHLRDLDMAQGSRFVPARHQWQVNTATHELSLRHP